ncbi:MAG: biotin/lipoyl-binding carrier protein [Actinomycetota bacterium]|nr:biotin/lipoyl-binding carrier protein [Actinomycetota bacterium]
MSRTIHAEMVASVHSVAVAVGESIDAGATLVVLESMKMEIPVLAEASGTVLEVLVAVGDVVQEGDALVSLSS